MHFVNVYHFICFFSDDVDRLKPPKRGFLQSILCCWRRTRTKTNQNGTPIDGSTTPPPLPNEQKYLLPQVRHSDMHKKCMVIDLDETLVHSSFKVIMFYIFISLSEYNRQITALNFSFLLTMLIVTGLGAGS